MNHRVCPTEREALRATRAALVSELGPRVTVHRCTRGIYLSTEAGLSSA